MFTEPLDKSSDNGNTEGEELFGNPRLIVSLLILTTSAYTCNLFLYGNPCYDFHTNKTILELTISFIISSKRFDGPLFPMTNDLIFSCVEGITFLLSLVCLFTFFRARGGGGGGFLWAPRCHCAWRGLKWVWGGCLCVYMYDFYAILVM